MAQEKPKRQVARETERAQLLQRLRSEGETDLAAKLAECGQPYWLECACCGTAKLAEKQCKRKWCPVCAWRISASRADEMRELVSEFAWPLFITLTMKNQTDLSFDGCRLLRRAFGKLRARKLWTARVRAGIATIEITDIGNGLHPHLHAVLDCSWLAWKTPPPQRGETPTTCPWKFEAAAEELQRSWAKCLGQPTASIKIKRCGAVGIAKEVVKYAVKPGTLLAMAGRVGPVIRALDGGRLLTTFGAAHGRVSLARARARNTACERSANRPVSDRVPAACCPAPKLFPQEIIRHDDPTWFIPGGERDRQRQKFHGVLEHKLKR